MAAILILLIVGAVAVRAGKKAFNAGSQMSCWLIFCMY